MSQPDSREIELSHGRTSRLLALGSFLLAVLYFLAASVVASMAARGLAPEGWFEFANRLFALFLYVVGFAALGRGLQRQRDPIAAMGLIRRPGAGEEFGVGAAVGWGLMVACVLPVALFGGFAVTFWTTPKQFGLLALNLLTLLVAALMEEVAFRGYPFQRLIEALGAAGATFVFSVMFGLIHLWNPGATFLSTVVTVLAGWLLSLAYLRTRALWLPWGLHFAWNASMGLLFGLPVSGERSFSTVIATNTRGPVWLTGDGYGPEGSLVGALVSLVGLIVLMRVTSDYAYRYAQPVIVAGGMPVNLEPIAQRQHEAAMGTVAAPAGASLVQILPVAGVEGPLVPERSEAGNAEE